MTESQESSKKFGDIDSNLPEDQLSKLFLKAIFDPCARGELQSEPRHSPHPQHPPKTFWQKF